MADREQMSLRRDSDGLVSLRDAPFDERPRPRNRKALRDWAMEELAEGNVADWNEIRHKDRGWRPNLSRLNLSRLDLSGVDFRNCHLTGSRLDHCNLIHARLDGVAAQGVRFDRSDLSSARLIGANLEGASFAGAWLDGVNFSGAKNLLDEAIAKAESAYKIRRDGPTASSKRRIPASPSVFLSYAWNDKQAVLAVDQWLRDRGARVIIDERNFVAGESIRDEILRWIDEAGVIVPFVSASSRDRPYPRLEREIADHLRSQGDKRVIYFNLDETILDVLHEQRLFIAGHQLAFEDACEKLWLAILRETQPPRAIDLTDFRDAGTSWTQLRHER